MGDDMTDQGQVPNHWIEASALAFYEQDRPEWVHKNWDELTEGERDWYREAAQTVAAALLAVPARRTVCETCDHGTDPTTLTTCNTCGGLGFIDSESIGEVLGIEWEQAFKAFLVVSTDEYGNEDTYFVTDLAEATDARKAGFKVSNVDLYRRVSKGTD